MPGEMREGTVPEAIGRTLPANTLLPNACHHLCNVDRGSFRPTLAHDQRGVVAMQGVHAHLHEARGERPDLSPQPRGTR